MKIHELAEQAGLSAATIRYYEKEGLLDCRHVSRERNNYRSYTDEALARIKLIKKLQSVGFSLAELRETMSEPNAEAPGNERVVEQVRAKIAEIERKRDEYDQILDTLRWMLEYRIALVDDPQRAESLLRTRRARERGRSSATPAAGG